MCYEKIDDTAPHEVMLVLDAGTTDAVNQTKTFLQSVGVTGLTLTKLDGTAKGGIIFALAKQFGLPVRTSVSVRKSKTCVRLMRMTLPGRCSGSATTDGFFYANGTLRWGQ